MDCLSTALSECASTTLKIESLCCKKNDFVFEKSQPTRKPHKRVYHCKSCGRDGHLAMFCYNNVANLHVRGQNPNLFAQKSFWVPKTHRVAPHIGDTSFFYLSLNHLFS
jgi:hypothetical protein